MKIILNKKLWLIGLLMPLFMSCREDETASVVQSFEPYTVEFSAGNSSITVDEVHNTQYTFNFELDESQISDVSIDIDAVTSSTATEGVDFLIDKDHIDLSAFEGREGFSVTVTVLQDGMLNESDETVSLVFSTNKPDGLSTASIPVLTINDIGLGAATVDFSLRWSFDNESINAQNDPCQFDFDLTIQPEGAAIYDGTDLLEFHMATLACPETSTMLVNDMVDGEVYQVWIAIYAGLDLGDDGSMTAYLDYNRGGSDFSGTVEVTDTFNSSMEAGGGIFFTLQKNGNTLTLKDLEGNVISEGRANRLNSKNVTLQRVKKQ